MNDQRTERREEQREIFVGGRREESNARCPKEQITRAENSLEFEVDLATCVLCTAILVKRSIKLHASRRITGIAIHGERGGRGGRQKMCKR